MYMVEIKWPEDVHILTVWDFCEIYYILKHLAGLEWQGQEEEDSFAFGFSFQG